MITQFFHVDDIGVSEHELNSDLMKISTYQWKMSFNPNIENQPQEVILS